MSMVDLKRLQGSPLAPTQSKRRWNSKSFSDKNLLSPSLLLVSPTKRSNKHRHHEKQQKQQQKLQRRSMIMLGERLVGVKNESFSLDLNSDTSTLSSSSTSNSSWGSSSKSSSERSLSSTRTTSATTPIRNSITTNRRRVSATTRSSNSAVRAASRQPAAPKKGCLKKKQTRSLRSSSSSPTSSSPSTTSRHLKKAHFTTVTIHEHGIVLGDNPSVSVGAPIQIDWMSQKNPITYDIDLYEIDRQDIRKVNRKDLQLPVGVRARYLLMAGYTIDDIANATIEANKIKIMRCVTANSKETWERLDTIKVGMIKSFRNLLIPTTTTSSSNNNNNGNHHNHVKVPATTVGAAAGTPPTRPCIPLARTA